MTSGFVAGSLVLLGALGVGLVLLMLHRWPQTATWWQAAALNALIVVPGVLMITQTADFGLPLWTALKGAIDQLGTPGWEIHPAIAPLEGDVVVQKRPPDAFQDANLQRELESKGIERLIITGIQTEYCVDTICRRAYSLGYDVTLVKDAHSTWDTDHLTAPQIIAHHNDVLGGWFAELKKASAVEEEINDGRTH